MNNPKPQEWKSEELSQGRIMDYKAFNFVDGEGVRCSLYVSGCLFHCEGCYNVATWSFKAGIPYTKELEDRILADLGQPYVQGLTLLGGEPFLNTGTVLPLVKRIRKELPEKDIWSWTGYTWEEMMLETPDKLELLSYLDILVDGVMTVPSAILCYNFEAHRINASSMYRNHYRKNELSCGIS